MSELDKTEGINEVHVIKNKNELSEGLENVNKKPKIDIKSIESSETNGASIEPKKITNKKKSKKPKPAPSDPTILMDLHELNPKLINSDLNKDYIKSLFHEYLPFERYQEITVKIVKFASNGMGIGFNENHPEWFVLVPFTMIGDVVKAKIFSHSKGYSEADLIEVISREPNNELTSPPCGYFGKCSGCQWQHLSYKYQLKLKEELLKRAFLYGSRPLMELIKFEPPEESPLKLHYRTKLTPHFDKPKVKENDKENKVEVEIGFNEKGRRKIMDIEDCILATKEVSRGYQLEREKVKSSLTNYKKGATLIIRESLTKDENDNEIVTTIRNHKDIVTQPVGDLRFKYPSGSFFQVNASILPRLTEYVMTEFLNAPLSTPPQYLLDVYCGSGLFAVACSEGFKKVVGVDVNDQSIAFASQNAELNNKTNCSFKLGEAEIIFNGLEFKGDETAVIIDPPRKGCSEDFIKQLIEFAPSSIVYVSCNPFTQARDIQMLLNLTGGYEAQLKINQTNPSNFEISEITKICPDYQSPKQVKETWNDFSKVADNEIKKQYEEYLHLKDSKEVKKTNFTYKIVKVKPFDMFPQTMHIESLLTLVKVPIN